MLACLIVCWFVCVLFVAVVGGGLVVAVPIVSFAVDVVVALVVVVVVVVAVAVALRWRWR